MTVSLLEQASPNATTLTAIFTVPPGFLAKIAEIYACNASGATRTVRLAISKGGGAINTASYIYYDAELPEKQTLSWYQAEEVQLDAGDVVRVYASGASVAFGIVGRLEPLPASSAEADIP